MNGHPFVDAVRAAICRFDMVGAGDTVVVAASGGPDSTAMLHALWSLRSELGICLVAATMEHGIRGAESVGDAKFVLQLCASLDIPCRSEHIDIPAIAEKRQVSSSVAARDERHRFLQWVAADLCAPGRERIAIGHTSDDRAETILLNIIRGAGMDGLCAMPAVSAPIIRPILSCTRSQASEYCSDMRLSPCIDSSNALLHYPRNRIRTELLPYLATYYNTGVRDALIRMAEICHDDLAILRDESARLLEAATIELNGRDLVLNAAVLRVAPVGLQRRALRAAIELVRGELTDIGFDTIEAILRALAGSLVTGQTLPRAVGDQIHVRVTESIVLISPQTPRLPISQGVPWQVLLNIPGEVRLPCCGRHIVAEVAPVHTVIASLDGSETQDTRQNASMCWYIKADLTEVITVRSWKPGDRIHPKGLKGTKKLQDLYTDCKVPRSERHLVPVIESYGLGIVAVLGVRNANSSLNKVELRDLAASQPDEQIAVIRMINEDCRGSEVR